VGRRRGKGPLDGDCRQDEIADAGLLASTYDPDATVEDVSDIYTLGWRLGLKAIATPDASDRRLSAA